MKVIEIIRESRPLDEGGTSTLERIIQRILGRGAERDQLVIDIAKRLAERSRYSGDATIFTAKTTATELGPKAREMIKNEPTILNDALELANKVKNPSIWDKLLGRTGTEAIEKAEAKLAKGAPSWWWTVIKWGGFASAWAGYVNQMNYADEMLAAGTIPPEAQGYTDIKEWYADYQKDAIGLLIGKIAAVYIAGGIAKIPTAILGNMVRIIPFGVGEGLSTWILKAGGAAAGIAKLATILGVSTEVGSDMLATLLVSTGLGQGIGGGFGTGIPAWFTEKVRAAHNWAAEKVPFLKDLTNALDHVVTNVTGLGKIDKPTTTPGTGGQDTKPGKQLGGYYPGMDQIIDPNTGKAPVGKWVPNPSAPGYMMNTVTGDIRYGNQ